MSCTNSINHEFFATVTIIYTVIASYFWSGAGAGFFHAPTCGGEHWRGEERIFGRGGTKGVCSRRNGAYPSLLLSKWSGR